MAGARVKRDCKGGKGANVRGKGLTESFCNFRKFRFRIRVGRTLVFQ